VNLEKTTQNLKPLDIHWENKNMNTKELLDAKPILKNSFFSEETHLELIYKIVNDAIIDGESQGEKYKHFFVNNNGMHILRLNTNNSAEYLADKSLMSLLLEQLQEQVSVFLKKEVINISGYFGRYSKDSGFAPRLEPHVDEAKIGEQYRMALTSRLKSSIEWDILVEKERYKLEENSALFFSANLKIHCRPKEINFSKEDHYDILVLHFDFKDADPWLIDQEYLNKKAAILDDKELRTWYDSTRQ
jgi:hypothetical protein